MKAPHNVLVLTYWSLSDALIQAYTLPYVKIIQKQLPPGSMIHLLTLEKDLGTTSEFPLLLSASGIQWKPFAYYPFGLRAMGSWFLIMLKLLVMIHKSKISTIHCWATPVGAIGFVLSWLTGKSLVIDSYEPHAEAMVENGAWKRNSLAFRLLFAFEKYQTRHAKHLIAAHEGMRSYALVKYGVDIKNMMVKPACVDLTLFDDSKVKDRDLLQSLNCVDKIVCVYAGKFGGIYLDNEVFDFLREAHRHWGDRFRVLLLTSHREEEINGYCLAADLDRSIIVTRFVSHHEIPKYIGLADFALTPVKPVPTKRYCTPIKDGEYWAMGLPVVIPAGISEDSEIIRKSGFGAVLDRLDSASYRDAFRKIDRLLNLDTKETRSDIRGLAIKYRNFEIAKNVYKVIYA